MTKLYEKMFFDKFNIECDISYHQQYNGAQVERGLQFFKERQVLAEKGFIKIWHKMLNPRPENDCVYWGEYHYPKISNEDYLELICLLVEYNGRRSNPYHITALDVEHLKIEILSDCRVFIDGMLSQKREKEFISKVQEIFKRKK